MIPDNVDLDNDCRCGAPGIEIAWQLRTRQDYAIDRLGMVLVMYAVLACPSCGVVYRQMTQEEIECELNQPPYEMPEPRMITQIADEALKTVKGHTIKITPLDADGAVKWVWDGKSYSNGDTITITNIESTLTVN